VEMEVIGGWPFTVKSTYDKLLEVMLVEDRWHEEERKVFGSIWKSPAPLKVVVFSWKALQDRIPSKYNLGIRDVLPTETSVLCDGCGNSVETTMHILLHCDLAKGVWLQVMRWWNISLLIPPNLFIHWACWSSVESRKRLKKGLGQVWHTSIWVLWKARNDRIFNEGVVSEDSLVEEIQVWSWRWAMYRLHMPPCMFFEWSWNPRDCILR
jgi:hypothetical protein